VLTSRIILVALVAAQLTDAITFTAGVTRHGIGIESNGIASWLFGLGGLQAVLLAKGIALVATVVLLSVTATRYPRLFVWGGAAATSIGLLGFATNSISLALLG
jgi:hypothetical protein